MLAYIHLTVTHHHSLTPFQSWEKCRCSLSVRNCCIRCRSRYLAPVEQGTQGNFASYLFPNVLDRGVQEPADGVCPVRLGAVTD
jgi:hypothetical protein